jgi:hypothetical protein
VFQHNRIPSLQKVQKIVTATVTLDPLRGPELARLLEEAGFNSYRIDEFRDYRTDPPKPNELPEDSADECKDDREWPEKEPAVITILHRNYKTFHAYDTETFGKRLHYMGTLETILERVGTNWHEALIWRIV